MTIEKDAFLAHVRRAKALDKGVARAVDSLWDMLDTSDMESLYGELAIYLPLVADKFGQAAAVEASEFFDECRIAAGAKGSYTATTAKGGLWRLDRDIAYSASAEFAYTDVKSFLVESAIGVVRDYGRETMRQNCRADRSCRGYNSVPTNSNPCVFCIMKALGSYYNYQGRKLDYEVHQDAWHPGCKCELIPVWKESPHWAVGDYERYQGYYDAGREAAEKIAEERGVDTSKGLSVELVQAGMRKANGISH